ncbi:hypothetical protein ACFSQ7_34850 [Paenibacillus rhizoplanae]
MNYSISMGHAAPKDYKERDHWFVVHGGGWGMGTYKETAAELNHSLDLNIVIHRLADDQAYGAGHRYYMVKPGWSPWMKNEEHEYTLPPFGEVINNSFNEDTRVKHSFYQLICNSKAIISKPGEGPCWIRWNPSRRLFSWSRWVSMKPAMRSYGSGWVLA